MLTNQTAVITGGSRGIGRAIALKMAESGANVAIVYAGNEEAANETCALAAEHGVTAKAYRCDVSDFDATKDTVAQILADFGQINILVNNAGITRDGLLVTMQQKAFDEVLATNLGGAYHMIRQVAPLMLRRRWGRIINVSSVAGLMGNAGQANYAASKAGLIGLTKSAARELAPRGITCNAVAPGFIQTDMTKNIAEDSGLAASIPLGHMGRPEDVARAIVFLAESDYITGEVLRIDGGLAM